MNVQALRAPRISVGRVSVGERLARRPWWPNLVARARVVPSSVMRPHRWCACAFMCAFRSWFRFRFACPVCVSGHKRISAQRIRLHDLGRIRIGYVVGHCIPTLFQSGRMGTSGAPLRISFPFWKEIARMCVPRGASPNRTNVLEAPCRELSRAQISIK